MKAFNTMMTRRQALLAGLGTMATLGLAACGGSSSTPAAGSSTSDTSADIATFVVGFDQNFPPYGYVGDDGEFTGFDLELAAEVCSRNGWEVEYDPIDWDAKDALINAGEITCIWNGLTLEGREDDYTFSDPYLRSSQVIVVRADSGITTTEDLAGKNVQVQVDSTALHLIESDYPDLQATFGTFEQIGDTNTMFMNLEAGACDALVCGSTVYSLQSTAKPGVYAMVGETLNDEHVAIGFKKGSEALAEKVSETLKAMDEDGFVKELCNKYADQGINYDFWCL